MPVRILTIPFDPDRELFRDEDLINFLLNKRVKKLRPEFFSLDGRPYWTLFVDYETILKDQEGVKEDGLDEAQMLLLQRMREWRKEKAEKDGVPVYIIATNKQLVDVVRLAPLSLEALRQVHGFGKKKVDKHGDEVVKIIKNFYEKSPLRSKGKLSLPYSSVPKPELGNKEGATT